MSVLLETIVNLPGIIILAFNTMFLVSILTYKKLNIQKKLPKELPKVSIIVAAWNEGPRIERAINSILELDYPKKNLEIIIVGGGTDNTSEVCKRLEKKNHLIKYIEEKERRGKWYALNTGVDNAKYDYLAFTDADGTVSKTWLKGLIARSADADIVVSTVDSLHDDGILGKSFAIACSYMSVVGYGFTKLFNASTYSGTGSFMKKSLAKEIKFTKSHIEDYRFCFMAGKKGYKIRFAFESRVHYGRPKSFIDWRKCYLRLYTGMISEMLFLKDPFAILTLFMGILTLMSVLIVYAIPGILGMITFTINTVNIIVTLMNIASISKIYEGRNQLFRFPYLVIYFYFSQLVGIESFFRWLLKRDIGWPIYNKT